jgi:hypothetical protein
MERFRVTKRRVVRRHRKRLGDQATEEHVAAIRQIWSDTLDKNLEVGDMLCRLQISKGEWELYDLPFSYTKGNILINIVSDSRIHEHRHIMPDSIYALNQIHKLGDVRFAKAVEEQVIHKQCSAQDIKDWLRNLLGVPDLASYTSTWEITEDDTEGIPVIEIARRLDEWVRSIKIPGAKLKSVKQRGMDWDWKNADLDAYRAESVDTLLAVLGLSAPALWDDIKRAHRNLVKKYHPDKSGGDPERFRKVQAAYQALKERMFR